MSAYTIFVTGPLGSGKTQVRSFMEERGAASLDADVIGASVRSNPLIIQQLAEAFGDGILDAQGHVVPSLLADQVFKSQDSVFRLNDIMFPSIQAKLREEAAALSDHPLLVVEASLLPWSQELLDLADEVIVVEAPAGVRLERACSRGMDYADALRRMRVQPSDSEYRQIADTRIDNDAGLDLFLAELQRWWDSRVEAGLF